jgi:hypothetical protein
MTTDPRLTDMTYLEHLTPVTDAGNVIIREKTLTYGASWKRRGGAGAWFTMVRPWDRLERIVEGQRGDIFEAIRIRPEGEDGSALACVRDLRNYLTLTEAEMVAEGREAAEDRAGARAAAGLSQATGELSSVPANVQQLSDALTAALHSCGLTSTAPVIRYDHYSATVTIENIKSLPGR